VEREPGYAETVEGDSTDELEIRLDQLVTRFAVAVKELWSEGDRLGICLFLRGEWEVLDEQAGAVIEELLKRAESSHTPEEIEDAIAGA
jgi:hypothetical protein